VDPFFGPFSMMGNRWIGGMMEHGSIMRDSSDHDHDISDFSTWEEMREHMEEEHGKGNNLHKKVDYDKPAAESHKSTYDFGKIKRSGGAVSTIFEIENHGKAILTLKDISTSCGCTTAKLDKTQLGFNEEANLTVFIDPNYHEEPLGKITRSVFVKTNDTDLPEMQFDVYVEIID